MNKKSIAEFIEQPYVTDTFNAIVNSVVDSVVDIENNNINMQESMVASFTDQDLAYLNRKVEYLSQPTALEHLKGILASKLQTIDNEVIRQYLEVMTYLESEEYLFISNIQTEAFEDFATEVNNIQNLQPIQL